MATERIVTDLSDWFLDRIDILSELCYDQEPIGYMMSVADYINQKTKRVQLGTSRCFQEPFNDLNNTLPLVEVESISNSNSNSNTVLWIS